MILHNKNMAINNTQVKVTDQFFKNSLYINKV